MKVYKVCCNADTGFTIYTYDFWSYILSAKLKEDGRLFFNRRKAEAFADECNISFNRLKKTINYKYEKLRESMFAD